MTGSRRGPYSPARSPVSGNISDNTSASKLDHQERFLPIANVSRIMKKSLPANAKISKEAKETVQECVSEFISFITGEASDKCQREKRKTINGDDLLWAMTTLGFENYVGPLKGYLNTYRESEGEKNICMATLEDHHHHDQYSSSPETNNNNNNSSSLVNPLARNFNKVGSCHVDAGAGIIMNPKGFGNQLGRGVTKHGDNMMMMMMVNNGGVYNYSGDHQIIHEIEIKDKDQQAMATNFDNGVKWKILEK